MGDARRRKRGGGRGERDTEKIPQPQGDVKAVITIPYTVGSTLAKKIREREPMMEKITGFRMKVVERVGVKLEQLLHKSDPWSGKECERPNCILCKTKQETEKGLTKSCSRRNLVYETWCRLCEKRDEEDAVREGRDTKSISLYKYIGETSRSGHERGWEHWQDAVNFQQGSHILKHMLDCHEGVSWDQIHFQMRVVKFRCSAFSRQIHESVVIQTNRTKHHLLNSKAEFNRCALPRLGLKMGDTEFKERRKEQDEERRKDEILEEKIRCMRREKSKMEGKKRAPQRYNKTSKKKLRLDSKGEQMEGDAPPNREIQLPRVKKRREETSKYLERPGKRMRLGADIRNFFKLPGVLKVPELPKGGLSECGDVTEIREEGKGEEDDAIREVAKSSRENPTDTTLIMNSEEITSRDPTYSLEMHTTESVSQERNGKTEMLLIEQSQEETNLLMEKWPWVRY